MRTESISEASTDQLEQAIESGEAAIARIRALQMEVLTELDLRQVPLADGSRNLAEWIAARLDLAPESAEKLARATRRLVDQEDLAAELADGVVSFDRVVEESRLVASGASPELASESRRWGVAGVRRMVARHQRLTRHDERRLFGDRSIAIQPNLEQTFYRVWGGLPGMEGRLVEQALTHRAEQFPKVPDGRPQPRGQRIADALVALSQDSLDGHQSDGSNPGTPLVSIFVDADLAAETNGEAGTEIDCGVRVGSLTLEEILCDGRVEILQTGITGEPLTLGKTSRTIPPKLRRFVLHRDRGACTADGCRSRYRLQPHHIIPRSQGGTHHPSNLTTLCWYHHHVVVHRNGYRIDPDSPPQRRRFLRPHRRGPP
jgi:hypothetical protein